MPLRDHFRSPVNDTHSWDEVHGQWPGEIVRELVTILPAGGFGEVLDQQVFPPAYAAFREKTGIKVTTLKVPENDIPDKLTTMVAGGTPPEVTEYVCGPDAVRCGVMKNA